MSLSPKSPSVLQPPSSSAVSHRRAASVLAAGRILPSAPSGGAPKYDRQTEMKTKGVVEEINVLTVGSRKDFTELVLKSGDDKLHIYVCPKPFQDEMGINFAKGDELAITGSKVKQDASEIILAREMVKGHRHADVPRRQGQAGVGREHRQSDSRRCASDRHESQASAALSVT